VTVPRTYRLAPRDGTGWFLGLDAVQVGVVTAGLLAGSLLAGRHAYAAALGVVLVSLAAAFIRVGDQPLHSVAGLLVGFSWRRMLGRDRWLAPIGRRSTGPVLPHGLGAVEVSTVPAGPLARFAAGPDVAVVADRTTHRRAVSMRVSGGGFALADPGDQDRVCAGWGDALAACASGAARPVAVVVTMRVTPAIGMPGAARRETAVTVVAEQRRRSDDTDTIAVVAEAARLGERLVAAGLTVDGVLDEAGWAGVVRESCDPWGQHDRARSLGERVGVAHPVHAGPLAVAEDWSAVRVDGSWHRAFLVADWPRVEVPASWLAGLLLCDGPTWSLTVSLEPISARRARQAVQRQAAKLSSDEEQRRRAGFRIGATHQRHHDDLEAREAELVAGHVEYDYVGVVIVSAATPAVLDDDSATLVAAAAGCGVELRPLHGRHLAALGAGLPVPGGLNRKVSR
jgi:hypothetical protein